MVILMVVTTYAGHALTTVDNARVAGWINALPVITNLFCMMADACQFVLKGKYVYFLTLFLW